MSFTQVSTGSTEGKPDFGNGMKGKGTVGDQGWGGFPFLTSRDQLWKNLWRSTLEQREEGDPKA